MTSEWDDACARREDNGSLRADGAPPKAEKQKGKVGRKQGTIVDLRGRAAMSDAWANDPARKQRHIMRMRARGALPVDHTYTASSAILDPDFDDMGA